MSYQIAIDGPAGAGKSTISRLVSERLGFIHIDTGAMYRAIGLFFKDAPKWPENSEQIAMLADKADISISHESGVQQIFLNGVNVSATIRTEEAGMLASKVSAYPEVRHALVAMQQNLALKENVVMDGRDIGTVVLKDAFLKIFLTASVGERAKRRYKELVQKGETPDIKLIEKDIEQRDFQDSTRKTSPLKQADDAILLDTTSMMIEEVVNRIVSIAKERMDG